MNKYHTFILVLFTVLNLKTSAYFDNYTFGAGLFAENSAVQKEGSTDGTEESLGPKLFFRASFKEDLMQVADIEVEAGVSLPSDSQDSTVSKMNYWLNFLLSTRLGLFEPQAGFGFYFTRLSIAGGTKELQNGTTTAVFTVPEGAVVATNNVLILGLNHYPSYVTGNENTYFNFQINRLNAEDSVEAQTNFFLSLNYKI